jgi:hypothetical protein
MGRATTRDRMLNSTIRKDRIIDVRKLDSAKTIDSWALSNKVTMMKKAQVKNKKNIKFKIWVEMAAYTSMDRIPIKRVYLKNLKLCL